MLHTKTPCFYIQTWSQVAAFAVAADGRAAVLPSAGYTSPDSPPANYVASLVADRRVIVPGDNLKVTGER
jgi:hypothetical protein